MSERDWSDAVAEASDGVAQTEAAIAAAAEAQKPKSSPARLLVVVTLFTMVVAWDVYVLTRTPEGLPPAEQEVDLAWLVAGAAYRIESFRAEQGALPTPQQASAFLDVGVDYAVQGDGFSVVAEEAGIRVAYDGSTPIEEWIAAQRAKATEVTP